MEKKEEKRGWRKKERNGGARRIVVARMQQHRHFRCILPVLVVSFFQLEDPLDAAYRVFRVIFSFFYHKGNASVIVCVHCTIRVNGVKEWELTRRRKKTDRRKSRIIRWRSFDKSRQKRLPLKSTRRTLTSCKVFFVEWMERWPNRVTNVSTKQKLKQR